MVGTRQSAGRARLAAGPSNLLSANVVCGPRFWDTPLNSILLDRTLACVGELTWNTELALCFWFIDGELAPAARRPATATATAGARAGTPWVRASAGAMVLVYVVARAPPLASGGTGTVRAWHAVQWLVSCTQDKTPLRISRWPRGDRDTRCCHRSAAGRVHLVLQHSHGERTVGRHRGGAGRALAGKTHGLSPPV